MTYTLGVDIGTFETKGVLVDAAGQIVAQAARAHKMLVPRSGWAEHRAEEDWWGDFVFVTKALLAKTQVKPEAISAIACSAIGPCMLPVDATGAPLMNAVLYGVDTRAAAQITELNQRIGEEVILARCGNALLDLLRVPPALPVHLQDDALDAAVGATTQALFGSSLLPADEARGAS